MNGLLRPLLTRGGFGPELIAEGVWRVQGEPGRMNVYLIEDGDELVQFDAGGRCMLDQLRTAIRWFGRPLRDVPRRARALPCRRGGRRGGLRRLAVLG